MSDHDLRRQDREIREALERFEKEQLIQILAHVFSQYVMTGSERVVARQVARGGAAGGDVDELAGLSFAKLIERLQLRLDLPELQLFEVQEGRVSVRTGSGQVALRAPGGQSEPLPRQAPAAGGAAPAAAPATVAAPVVVSANAPVAPSPAAPGTSVAASLPAAGPVGAGYAGGPGTARTPETRAGTPSSVAVTARPAGGAAAQPVQPVQPAAKPAGKDDKPAAPVEEGGGRFSMLEID